MATVDIRSNVHVVTIEFDNDIPDALLGSGSITLLANNLAGVPVFYSVPTQIVHFMEGNRLIPNMHPEKFIELIMRDYQGARIGFLVDGKLTLSEPVQFTSKLLQLSYDPIRLSTNHHKLPQKSGRVAIFTQSFNEGDMLLYWEAYYAKQVGYENLYVLNNASTDNSCDRLNKKTTVVNLPYGPVDHDHFAQSHGYFLRFLLLKYDWVIKVDADEFVVCEGDLVDTLNDTPSGIYLPEKAIEVVHDRETEAPFDFSRSVGEQRRQFVRGTDALLRPIICSEPATWTPGNHFSHEHSSVLPGFLVVHLKYFDYDFLLSKNNKWSKFEQTPNESKTCAAISVLQQMDPLSLLDHTDKEMLERIITDRVEIPEWLAAKL